MAVRTGSTITAQALFGDTVIVSEDAAGTIPFAAANLVAVGNGNGLPMVFGRDFWRSDAAGLLWWGLLMFYLRRRLGSFARE